APAGGATRWRLGLDDMSAFLSALPRGERLLRNYSGPRLCRFLSALPRGERRLPADTATATTRFLSALPRGERQARGPHVSRRPSFYPRSRGGSDAWALTSALPCNGFYPRSRGGSDACRGRNALAQ